MTFHVFSVAGRIFYGLAATAAILYLIVGVVKEERIERAAKRRKKRERLNHIPAQHKPGENDETDWKDS